MQILFYTHQIKYIKKKEFHSLFLCFLFYLFFYLMNLSWFPHELLEIIASNLSTNDQYIGLTVCKSWYLPFCRILYRNIIITHRSQLKKLIFTTTKDLYHGKFIRTIQIGVNDHTFKPEDCVTGAIPLLPIQVGVTSQELHSLTQLPRLNSLYFDPRLWQFINPNNVTFQHSMKQLPPLDNPRQLVFLNQIGVIQKLHIRGSDMFQLHQDNKFLAIFKSLPLIHDLTIDGDGMWDTEHIMQFTTQDLDTLHSYLPNLCRLNITDAIHIVHDESYTISTTTTKLEYLTLFASVERVDSLCHYLGTKHPHLSDLHLNIISSHTRIEDHSVTFTRMLNRLNRLVSLKLHPNMCTQQFIHDQTFDKISSVLNHLELGLWQPNALKKIRKDLLPAITHLWIPTWNSTIIDLSVLKNLSSLELKCSSQRDNTAIQDKPLNTVLGVDINTILNTCSSLTHLEIQWGNITFDSSKLNRESQHGLKTLRLDHVSIGDTNLFGYISKRCKLEGLFLRECLGITEINMLNTHFKYIVLSELNEIHHLKLIQFQRLEKQRKRRRRNANAIARYYKSYKDQYTYQTCISRLNEEPENTIALLCGSIDKLLFNGCRI